MSTGIIMVPAAVLKLYAIGTLLSVIAVIFDLGNSVGGLMYSPDYRYIDETNHQTHGELRSWDRLRGRSVNKNVGS